MLAHRYVYILLSAILLLLAPGCVPFAYVKPEVDIYHASLPIPEVQPGEDDAVVAVEIQQNVRGMGIQSGTCDFVELIPVHGNSVTNVAMGSEWSVGYLWALSYSTYREFDSTVKVYRRGYRTQKVDAALFSEVDAWEACKTLQEREIAIDTLSTLSDVATPAPPTHFRSAEEEDDQEYLKNLAWGRTRARVISPAALRFLIREYELIARMAHDPVLQGLESRCRDKASRLRRRLHEKTVDE